MFRLCNVGLRRPMLASIIICITIYGSRAKGFALSQNVLGTKARSEMTQLFTYNGFLCTEWSGPKIKVVVLRANFNLLERRTSATSNGNMQRSGGFCRELRTLLCASLESTRVTRRPGELPARYVFLISICGAPAGKSKSAHLAYGR